MPSELALAIRDEFPNIFPEDDYPESVIEILHRYTTIICDNLGMVEHVNLLTGHLMLLWFSDQEAPGINDTPGEVLAEQYIQKRAEFRSLAEQGNHVWYTRTFLGTIFYTYLQTGYAVGIVDI